MAKSLLVLCFALLAVGHVAGEASLEEKLVNLKGRRNPLLFESILTRLQNPNGFSIGFGIGLEGEVDEIEAGLDLGPFEFKLDPIPVEDEEEEEEEEEKKPACNEFCDTHTGLACCMNEITGFCAPNGKPCPEEVLLAGGYGYGYGK